MSRPRFTGEPAPPNPVGLNPTKPDSNRNFPGKAWVRRTRHKEGFGVSPPEWPSKPEPPKSPIFKMVPPMPPMAPKQPVHMMHYYPVNPVMYPNMVIKDDKIDKDPKPKFPAAKFMGPTAGVQSRSYMSSPFISMSNSGMDAKSGHDKYSKPYANGPYYKEPPVHSVMYKDPPLHNPPFQDGYVNLSQVKLFGNRQKRNFETMSEISDEQESDPSDRDKPAPVNEIGPLTSYEIKYYTPFLPKAPERYKAEYDLHELNAFLPLGVKAYIKNTALDPKLASGFETGPVRNGKLVLLLDLDNTLLHTASQSRLDMLDIDPFDFVDSLGDPELYRFTLPNFPNITYYMKLRPCIREFLQILSLYYEMSIYTNATKEYADVVISILDPDRSLFMDRIVARNSVDEKDLLKSASRLYPDLDPRFILAFDDRRDVWSDIPHKQVVRAEHYDFFESYLSELNNNYTNSASDQNKANAETTAPVTPVPFRHPNKSGNDYTFNVEQESESDPEAPPEKIKIVDYDRHLKYMVRVFLEIHKRFFLDPFRNDVGDILESMQTQILKGLGVLLTGYRKNAKMTNSVLHADCEQKQKESLIELGATVVSRLNDSKLTHIMAGKNCTDNITKSRDIQYNNIYKIHTLWLYSCKATFTKVDESLFNVDDVCNLYANEPPQLPNKDHWKFLSKATKVDKHASESGYNGKTKEDLPTRIFMGTGAYSNGTEVISSVEKIVIKWDPTKTKLLQNTISDSAKLTARHSKIELTPFTNSVNPNKYAYQ